MKKNMMMRLASVLLIAVLMSTCAISGTFAKYVTSDSVTDTARVAKFGVTVETTGSLFGSQYASVLGGNGIETWANAHAGTVNGGAADAKVVAPGTQNAEGMTFSITGTPEVAVNVNIEIAPKGKAASEAAKDIFLAAGTYDDLTTGKADTFDTAEYHPVKFTLTKNGTAVVTAGTLADVETYLEKSMNYAPNTDLTETYGIYKLTWVWDFDDAGAGTYDKQDTLLGDLAAGTATIGDATKYNLTIDFEIKITVTQID